MILTGNLNDGSAGLWAVKEAGGLAVVQDPTGILYPSLPQSALEAVDVDHVAPVSNLSTLNPLAQLLSSVAPSVVVYSTKSKRTV